MNVILFLCFGKSAWCVVEVKPLGHSNFPYASHGPNPSTNVLGADLEGLAKSILGPQNPALRISIEHYDMQRVEANFYSWYAPPPLSCRSSACPSIEYYCLTGGGRGVHSFASYLVDDVGHSSCQVSPKSQGERGDSGHRPIVF